MRYIDFHTHILPEIDDGAKTITESIDMLKAAYAAGAETVILTPHYHPAFPLPEFLKKREKQYAALKKAMKADGGDFPKLLLGAEVLMDGMISDKKELEKLCIEGTNLLLLELPYHKWNDWHFQEVYRIMAERDLSPVMAHIERYLRRPKDLSKIDQLISFGARFQINANSFLHFNGRRIIRALAAEGLVGAIGSDAHGVKFRSADVARAMNKFADKFGDPFIDYLYNKTSKLLSEHSI